MKWLMTIALMALSVAVFAGDDVKIDGEFKQVANGKLKLWTQNKGSWAKPYGKIEILPGKDKDEHYVKIVAAEKDTHLYTLTKVPVKEGQTLEVEATFKGKGDAAFGAYYYTEKNQWVNRAYKIFSATDKFQEKKAVFKVKTYKDKVPAYARIVIMARKNSEITFEEVEVEVK